jgi:hypothetical protein
VVKIIKIFFLGFSAVVFLLTTLSLAYHHHDLNFTYSTCSICKAKGSLSHSAKTKIDKPFQMAVNSLLSPSFLMDAVGKAPADKVSLYNLFESHPFSNKSPPARS